MKISEKNYATCCRVARMGVIKLYDGLSCRVVPNLLGDSAKIKFSNGTEQDVGFVFESDIGFVINGYSIKKTYEDMEVSNYV